MRTLARHDRATWQAMGAAGRARYEARFTAQRMNAELAALYAELSPVVREEHVATPLVAHA